MPTLAFWNVNAKVSAETIAVLARERDVDIIILAENETDRFKIKEKLNEDTDRLYFTDPGESERLTIFTRFQADRLCLVRDSSGGDSALSYAPGGKFSCGRGAPREQTLG